MAHKSFTLDGRAVDTPARYQRRTRGQKRPRIAGVTPPVGTVRGWLGLDDAQGLLYRKDYTLRGVGDKIEVWVANDSSFPAGDCRAQTANSTVVTDAQVNDLVNQLDTNVYPKETAAFSTPPDRDGSNDKTVVLIDNVRDDNYYSFPAAPSYIPGTKLVTPGRWLSIEVKRLARDRGLAGV